MPDLKSDGGVLNFIRKFQLEELSRSVEDERAHRSNLEQTICELRNETPDTMRVELDRLRRHLDEERNKRAALEGRQGPRY